MGMMAACPLDPYSAKMIIGEPLFPRSQLPFLDLFQMFSRLLLEKQSATGAPASAPISCIGRISGCTAGHSASCISVAFHTFELHQELASGWLALHWPNSSHLPLPGQLPSHLRNRI